MEYHKVPITDRLHEHSSEQDPRKGAESEDLCRDDRSRNKLYEDTK